MSNLAFNPIEICREVGEPYTYPRKPRMFSQEQSSVSVKYPSVSGMINRDSLFLAQQLARFAGNCRSTAAKDRYINQANYELTRAYMGGTQHELFWNQGF